MGLGRIARPSGAFAMVATDQRESLRTIYQEATGALVGDEVLRAFKVSAARILTPHASAILVDRDFGLQPILAARALDPSCGLIVAADALVQEAGGPVTDSALDTRVVPEAVRAQGAVALKLLVIWRDDDHRERRHRLAGSFISMCRGAGLLSVVEVIVRAPVGRDAGWDRETDALEAAREIGALRPDPYKAEMPYLGQTEPARMEEGSRALTEAAPGPGWSSQPACRWSASSLPSKLPVGVARPGSWRGEPSGRTPSRSTGWRQTFSASRRRASRAWASSWMKWHALGGTLPADRTGASRL